MTVTSREQRLQARLALPVLVASLVSVPAVFLTFAPGVLGTTGRVLDLASGAVLLGETVTLLAVAEDKRAWVRGHRGLLVMTGVVVVGVVRWDLKDGSRTTPNRTTIWINRALSCCQSARAIHLLRSAWVPNRATT